MKPLYNMFRNRANRELKNLRILILIILLFEEHCYNIQNIWKGIRSIINLKNPVNLQIAQLNINGRIIDI